MKKAVKVRAYIYPTKEILEKDVVPEKGWSLSGVLKGMKEALKVYGGSERKNWKDNDIKIVKVFEDGTEEEISLKDSVPENKRKELREMYDRLYDILTEGANADIPNNIKKAYDIVGGKCYFHEKKPTFLSVEGKVGDYTLTNMISLNERLYGDLNRLASDLTMAYAKSKGINPEMRTPDFIRSLNDKRINFNKKERKLAEDALSGVTPYAMRMKRQNEREAIETQLNEIEHLIDMREDFLESDKADDQPEEVLNRIMKQIKYLNIKKSELTKRYEDLFSQEYGYWKIGDSTDPEKWAEKIRYWIYGEGKELLNSLMCSTDTDFLSKHSFDKDAPIRMAVAGNLYTPKDILKLLSKDKDDRVRKYAKSTLNAKTLNFDDPRINDAKKNNLNETLKAFYVREYPDDDLGKFLDDKNTFEDLRVALITGRDVYDLMGEANDSVIRERLFSELAKRLNVDYDWVYNMWIRTPESIRYSTRDNVKDEEKSDKKSIKKANMNDDNDWFDDDDNDKYYCRYDDYPYDDDYDDDRPKHRYWFYIHGDISTEISNGTLSESELYDVKYMCFNKFADDFLDTFKKYSEFYCDINELGIELSDNVEEENEFDFLIETGTEEYTEQELKKMFADGGLLEKTYSGDTESGVHYDCKIKVINIVFNYEEPYTD